MSKQTQIKGRRLTAVVAGIAMLAATALSLGVATFAWFTRGTEASATGFNFTASAAQGIQISTTASTASWRSNITAGDFNTTTGAQAGNRTSVNNMEPISTINQVENGAFTFWRAEYQAEGNAFDIDETADVDNFLIFDLYFLNEGGEDQELRLGEDSVVIDGDVNRQTSLSTRVGFVVQGSLARNDAEPDSIVALNDGIKSRIWEPNSLRRSTAALSLGIADNAKYEYHGLKDTNTDTIVPDEYGAFEGGDYSELVDDTFDLELGDEGIIATLPELSVTKVTVFVWLEGQDVDSNNATSAGDVEVRLHFDAGEGSVVGKTAQTPTAGQSEVVLNAEGTLGATYNVYVLRPSVDGVVGLKRTFLVATGTGIHTTEEPFTLAGLDGDLEYGDVVVVKGLFNGLVETITDTTVA